MLQKGSFVIAKFSFFMKKIGLKCLLLEQMFYIIGEVKKKKYVSMYRRILSCPTSILYQARVIGNDT